MSNQETNLRLKTRILERFRSQCLLPSKLSARPLIVLTGFPDTEMATSLLRQGVVDYLVKPVEGEKLKASVARAMEQRELAHL